MIFTGRSVDALDEVRASGDGGGRRDVSAVAIAAGWFSSLRRPGKRKKSYQKQAKSAWDLSVSSTTVSNIAVRDDPTIRDPIFLDMLLEIILSFFHRG